MRRAAIVVLALAFVPAAAAAPPVSVRLDRVAISTKLGKKFVFRSTIGNRGPAPASGLIAHLSILSLRTGTYVDPEDWSPNRTRYLPAIPPGGSVAIDWRMQAVSAGTFGVYVAVLSDTGVTRPVVGPTLRLEVASRRSLNSGGILPLALGIPAALGLAIVGFRLRRGRWG